MVKTNRGESDRRAISESLEIGEKEGIESSISDLKVPDWFEGEYKDWSAKELKAGSRIHVQKDANVLEYAPGTESKDTINLAGVVTAFLSGDKGAGDELVEYGKKTIYLLILELKVIRLMFLCGHQRHLAVDQVKSKCIMLIRM